MADKDADAIVYTRIAGMNARFGNLFRYITGNQLFMAPGHLVSVSFTGLPMYEKYARFYFSDIVSILYGPTPRQAIYYGIIGSLWVLSGIIFSMERQGIAVPGMAITTIGAIVLCFLNFWRGERCRFFIRTAVQNVEIPAVATMAQAREVLALLAPLILEAQQARQSQTTEPQTDTGTQL